MYPLGPGRYMSLGICEEICNYSCLVDELSVLSGDVYPLGPGGYMSCSFGVEMCIHSGSVGT